VHSRRRGAAQAPIPIIVRCECGAETPAFSGDVVVCECGREIHTDDVDSEQLAAARALRARSVAIARLGMAFVGLATIGGYLAAGPRPALAVLVAAGVVWLAVIQPFWRRRSAARIARLRSGSARAITPDERASDEQV
jgi:hypothetical protein